MSELLKRKSRKSKSKYKKFDRENKFRKQAQVALKVPSIEKARRASSPKFPAKSKGDSLAESIASIVGSFGKKKKIPGLDNKMFKSGTGEWVGTEEAYADAEEPLLNYIKGYDGMKSGGSIKKHGGKVKRNMGGPVRGVGAARQGFGKAKYSDKLY